MLKTLALLGEASGLALKGIAIMGQIFHPPKGQDCEILKTLPWQRGASRELCSHRAAKGSVFQGSDTWTHREHHNKGQRKSKLY